MVVATETLTIAVCSSIRTYNEGVSNSKVFIHVLVCQLAAGSKMGLSKRMNNAESTWKKVHVKNTISISP